jgi:hypothetical protein
MEQAREEPKNLNVFVQIAAMRTGGGKATGGAAC